MFHRLWILGQALIIMLLLGACAPAPAAPAPTATPDVPESGIVNNAVALADLDGVKAYVEKQSAALEDSIVQLKNASDRYYELVKSVNFDYAALWKNQSAEVMTVLGDARSAFLAANPQYEQMEGVVAGVPALSQYDIILDAGTAGTDGGENVVPFDLKLPNGEVLEKPGNLFEVTEAALWGTDPAYTVPGIHPDLNGNAQVDLGDALPDAAVLKGAADAFASYTAELKAAAQDWQPTEAEAFGALVANVPTFRDFMESWKNSRFVMGDEASGRGFVATSRLSDLRDNILSWQKIYASLSPAVNAAAPEQDAQINRDLEGLYQYVSDLYIQESEQGKQFTPEEVDILNAEGQNRATAIAGQIAQVAAQLGISVEVE